MAAATSDDIRTLATDLSGDPAHVEAAVTRLLEAAAGDKSVIEAARDDVARHLHGNAGDWTASATLALLNKALVASGWTDKYDWKIRWSQPFKRP